MKTKILVLLSVVFTFVLQAHSFAAPAYKYDETFDTYEAEKTPPTSAFHVGGSGTVLIKEIDENNVLSFEMPPNGQYRINNIVPIYGLSGKRFVFEEKLKVGSNVSIYAQLYTGMSQNDNYKAGKNRIIFNAVSGNIQNHDGNVIIQDAYTPDTWFGVKTVFYKDGTDIKYDIHIVNEKNEIVKSAYGNSTSADFGGTLTSSGSLRIRNMALGDTKNGKTDTVYLDDIRVYEATAPKISNISVSGIMKVGVELSLDYQYQDDYGNADKSIVQWYRDGVEIDGATASEYVLQEADYQKTVSVSVTPKSTVSQAGESTSYSVGKVLKLQNKIPVASELGIDGTAEAGGTLTAKYTYDGEENVDEGDTQITWYKKNESTQAVKVGDGITYTVSQSDEGYYIYFTVVPKDKEGTVGGEYKSDEIYINEKPYVEFTNSRFYRGFGDIKTNLSSIAQGTVSFEVTAGALSDTDKNATVVAMLINGDVTENMIVFPVSDLKSKRTYAGSFKVSTAKDRQIKIVAYNSLEDKKIISSSILSLK